MHKTAGPPDVQWQDLIARLWEHADPKFFSPEYQAYREKSAELAEHLITLPDGCHGGSFEEDAKTDTLCASIERLRRVIVDRFPATEIDIVEKALVIRDECFPPNSLEFVQTDGRDIAKLLASVIALHKPPAAH